MKTALYLILITSLAWTTLFSMGSHTRHNSSPTRTSRLSQWFKKDDVPKFTLGDFKKLLNDILRIHITCIKPENNTADRSTQFVQKKCDMILKFMTNYQEAGLEQFYQDLTEKKATCWELMDKLTTQIITLDDPKIKAFLEDN